MQSHISDYSFLEKRFETTDLLLENPHQFLFKAREKSNGRRVILKFLKARFPIAADLAKLWSHYEFSQLLSAEYTVPVLEHWHSEGALVLVLEDQGGGSLRNYAERRLYQSSTTSTRRQYSQVFRIALKIAHIFEYLEEKNICLGNLTPDDIWTNGSTSRVRCCNLSFARQDQNDARSGWHHTDVRDPRYLAPEIELGDALSATQQSDFYSLGAILYYLLNARNVASADVELEASDQRLLPKSFTEDVDLREPGGSVISGLMAKLLNRDVSRRYSRAAPLIADLKRCVAWLDADAAEVLGLGTVKDGQIEFKVCEELFGRERELKCLLNALDEVQHAGDDACSSKLVKVTGKAGTGKSALCQQFLGNAVSRGFIIAQGCYGQYRSDEPLSAILDAFTGLIIEILAEPDQSQEFWRAKLKVALADEAGVLVGFLPALEELIGVQPVLSPHEGELASLRFTRVLKQFIGAFYQSGIPLVLCLDSLQWADQSSIRLLTEFCSTLNEFQLLLVLSYRNDPSISLQSGGDRYWALGAENAYTMTVELHALRQIDIAFIVAKTFACSVAKGRPLAQLVEQKTKGDPFFVHQFLYAMHRESHIAFSTEDNCWVCDLSAVKRASLTENVVSFMGSQLQELEPDTLELLQVMSCFGSSVDIAVLARSMDKSRLQVARLVWGALLSGMVVLDRELYKFQHSANDDEPLDEFAVLYGDDFEYCLLHDRVRQAAYGLIPKQKRGNWHSRLSSRLLAHYQRGSDDRSLFDILDKLGSGLAYIEDEHERKELAALCLQAGIKARSYVAYPESLSYLQRGIHLLEGVRALDSHRVSVKFYLEAANSALLASRFNVAFELLDVVEGDLETPLEIMQHAFLRVQLYCLVNKLDVALEQGYKSLERFNRKRISEDQLKELLDSEQQLALKRPDLVASTEDQLALQLLLVMTPAAFFTTYDAYRELVCTQIQLCIDSGNSSGSPFAICNYGTLFLGRETESKVQAVLAEMAKFRTVFSNDEDQLRLQVLLNAFYRHWSEPLQQVVLDSLNNTEKCMQLGDHSFASYAAMFHAEKSLFCCHNLLDFEQKIRAHVVFSRDVLHQVPYYQLSVWHQVAINLIHGSLELTELEGKAFSERQSVAILEQNKNETTLFYLYFSKAVLAMLFDQKTSASRNIEKAKKTMQSCSATYCGALLPLFDIIIAFEAEHLSVAQEKLSVHRARSIKFVDGLGINLVHIERLLDAMDLAAKGQTEEAQCNFNLAIDGALKHGMVHDALLIKERAARFYLENQMLVQASVLIEQCYHDYNRWGAKAKAQHLRRQYGNHLLENLS